MSTLTGDQIACLRPLVAALGEDLVEFAESGNRLNSVQGESGEELALALRFRQGWYSGVLEVAEHFNKLIEEQEDGN